MNRTRTRQTGFTIVELLIVIVVIGILAAITIVAYNGINQKASASSLQSDLTNAATQLKVYQVDNGAYPTSNDCTTGPTPAVPKICLKSSDGNTFGSSYTATNGVNPQTFALRATRGTLSYSITNDSAPTLVAVVALTCPTGYAVVPGSATYGTSDFCLMRYEAKNVAGGATSQAASTPWVTITQTAALATASAACAGCHLVTEAEWMTVAQNVLGVASNWSGGSVGSGYVYSGHNDGAPGSALVADTNNTNGYSGTTDSSPSNQLRTLTLSNGEVIWDLSGNVFEWTAGTVTTGQPGITVEPYYGWREWTGLTTAGSLAVDVSPGSTGLPGASGWTFDTGVGQLYSNSSDTVARGFIRGGSWSGATTAGILSLRMGYVPATANTAIGFRVSK